MAKKPAPKQPVKPASPPPKGQKPPAAPLSGKSGAKPTGNTGKPTDGVPVKPALPVKPSIKPLPLKGDLGKPLVKSGQISAEMYAVGKGSRLCQSLMMALKHEGKPSHVSDENYLKRFARYGWDEEEDKQARDILQLIRLKSKSQFVDQTHQFLQIGTSNYGDDLRSDAINLIEEYELDLAYETLSTERLLEALLATSHDTGQVDLFRRAIEISYGISVVTDDQANIAVVVPELSIQALQNYAQGAEMLAQFFEQIYESDPNVLEINRFELYQAAMGEMTVVRIDRSPIPGSESFKGYASGHTIYDRFDAFSFEMTSENFAHELGHSFNYFAGFGSSGPGSFGSIAGFFEEAFATIKDKPNRQAIFNRSSPTEVFADLLMLAARGDIQDFVSTNFEVFGMSLRNAVNYHAPVAVVVEALQMTSAQIQLPPSTDGVNVRSSPSTEDNLVATIDPSLQQSISIISSHVSDSFRWYYVAIPGARGTQYGWVRGDLLGTLEPNMTDQIDPIDVDPRRPYSSDDPLNLANQFSDE